MFWVLFCFVFNILFIYSWETQTERERDRGRDTGRGRSRLHAGRPTWDLIPGLQDYTLGQRQAFNHWVTLGSPTLSIFFKFKDVLCNIKIWLDVLYFIWQTYLASKNNLKSWLIVTQLFSKTVLLIPILSESYYVIFILIVWCTDSFIISNLGIPGWRSGLAPAFGPGRDPGDPGWNPMSGSRCMEPASPSAYVCLCLCLSLSLCAYHK